MQTSSSPDVELQGSSSRMLDLAINALGILAVLCMAGSLIISRFLVDKVPAPTVGYLQNAGWACIGLYVLGMAWQGRESIKAFASSERGQSGSNLVLQVLFAVVLVGFINYMGTRYHKRWDFTENRQFSLSEQTEKILRELPGKVTLTMFVSPADRAQQANKDLLGEYAYAAPDKVTFKTIDADRDPIQVRRYLQSLPEAQRSKVLESGTIRLGTVVIEHQGNITPITGFNEQDFTSAILKATRTSQKTIYFVDGHGELDYDNFGAEGMTQVKQALEKQNYRLDRLRVDTRKGIPADAAALIVSAPKTVFTKEEVASLDAYVGKGGKVFLNVRPGVPTGLETWLKDSFGLKSESVLVVEENLANTMGYQPTLPAVVKYEFHAVTQSFSNYRIVTVFPESGAFTVSDKKPEGVTVDVLAKTSLEAKGVPLKNGNLADGEHLKGPLNLAVAVSRKLPGVEDASASVKQDRNGRLVVMAAPYFAVNGMLQRNASVGNSDFLLSGLNWLAEDETLVSIAPKNQESRTVTLLGSTQQSLFYGTVVLPPLALLVLGGVVWWRRR
ncbi:MAG: GldG family protein [Candidatus Sericytochromatia bacterium]|nr:GldG family protein [Candidatus Tanganyikabacteria bacterium]